MNKDRESSVRLDCTADYEKLIPLFIRAGLEIDERKPEGLLVCTEITEPDQGQLIGGAFLVYKNGAYLIKALAVEDGWRGRGFGTRLVEDMLDRAAGLGAREVYLNAKVPEFYRKLGFSAVRDGREKDLSDCVSCSRYGRDCHPQVMKKESARTG